MTKDQTEIVEPGLARRTWDFFKMPLLVGFIVGVSFSLIRRAMGWDVGQWIEGLSLTGLFEPSIITALTVGGLMVFISLFVGAGAFFPNYGIRAKMFADREDWEDQRNLFRTSAIGCFGWGGLMILLALVEPLSLSLTPLLSVLLLLCLAFLGYSCWMMLRGFDELWDDVHRLMCVWAFYGVFVVGGIWSVLAHLNLIPALTPLDWISLLTISSLVGSVIANGQRGLLQDQF